MIEIQINNLFVVQNQIDWLGRGHKVRIPQREFLMMTG